MKYRLYKSCFCNKQAINNEIKQFRPSLTNGMFLCGEKPSLKTGLVRFYFWLLSRGRVNIFYVQTDKGEILHMSYVLPRCFKFPFMKKRDYEIGPCYTVEHARGQGLYPKTLSHIVGSKQYGERCFWMLVKESNVASIRGVEKSGFVFVGYVEKTRIMKRYLKVEEN